MKKWIWLFLLFPTLAFGQSTSVTATITDSSGQAWINGSVTATFVPGPVNKYQWPGGAIPNQVTGQMDGSGTFTISLPDNSTITPIGSGWKFTLCSNTSAPCVTGPQMAVSGASMNLSTQLSAIATVPKFPATAWSYGYSDSEVWPIPVQGGMYWNVITLQQRCWTGSTWIVCSSNGGSNLLLQHNGTDVTDQSLMNWWDSPASLSGGSLPSGTTPVTFYTDDIGGWAGTVPTAATLFLPALTPATTEQNIFIPFGVCAEDPSSQWASYSSNGGSFYAVSTNAVPGGSATCSNPVIPSGLNLSDVTAVYGVRYGGWYYNSTYGNPQFVYTQFYVNGTQEAALPELDGPLPLQQTTTSTAIATATGSNLSTITAGFTTDSSSVFYQGGQYNIPFMGLDVVYSGPPVTQPQYTYYASPLYYNAGSQTVGLDPGWLANAADVQAITVSKLPTLPTIAGKTYYIYDGASSTDCTTGGGSDFVQCVATISNGGNSWTAYATGGGGSSITLQTNGTNNASQALLNAETSTANTVGLTVTPSNPSGGVEKWEITGSNYTGNAATATNLAAAPSQCSAGSTATGIVASGNANCLTAVDNLLSYGGTPDERDVTGCSTTASSSTLTCPSDTFTAADSNRAFLVPMGTAGVLSAVYVSGITATGSTGQTCNLSSFNGGGSGAAGVVYLTGTNAIATGAVIYTFPNQGSGYTSAPTSATAGNGTATCSGTVTLTSSLLPAAVNTTATYVSATTVTLGTAATTTGSNLVVSIGTDNSTALQNWINACEATYALCYAPAGQYLYLTPPTISSYIDIMGAGEQANLGNTNDSGYTWVLPSFAPYITGTVFVMTSPATDGLILAANGQTDNLSDFGIRFAPAVAFNNTGHGIYTSGSPHGPNYSAVSRIDVWGTDGSHYGFYLPGSGTNQFSFDRQWGGGGFYLYGNANTIFTNIVTEKAAYGAAVGIDLIDSATLNTFVRPQAQAYIPAQGGSAANFANLYLPPQVNESGTVFSSDTTGSLNTVISPDFEGGTESYPNVDSFVLMNAADWVLRTGNAQIEQSSNGNLIIGTGINTAAMLELGSGTWESVGSLPTLSGCSYSGAEGGASVGQFTAGATSCTVSVTTVGSANGLHGTLCRFSDLTTPADTFTQTASSTTGCTVTATVSTSDVIQYEILAY